MRSGQRGEQEQLRRERSGSCCGDQELFFTLRYELADDRGPNSVSLGLLASKLAGLGL